MTLTHLQKLPKNVRDLDKLIVAKGFKKVAQSQKITQSGHTAHQSSKIQIKIVTHQWLHQPQLICSHISFFGPGFEF